MPLKYVKPNRVLLKSHAEFNETWVQSRLAEDPSLLGLGELELKDKERRHPVAGRLDLLFQDLEDEHRYEVEVQLGKTDESHIIRTIEYWDNERKLYPQYDHTAVIVAEDITSRFLNVIGLFNGRIPLIALQMQAIQIGDIISLLFTTIVSELQLAPVDEDGGVPPEPANRTDWEERTSKAILGIVDEVVDLLHPFDQDLALKYNKYFIGLARNGQPDNYVVFKPKKEWLRIEVKLDRSDEMQAKLEKAGLDLMPYDNKTGKYKLRLTKDDVKQHEEIMRELLKAASDQAQS